MIDRDAKIYKGTIQGIGLFKSMFKKNPDMLCPSLDPGSIKV